ncbi:MAG TPA: hypothetical protein VIM00_14685 [Candidatus Acidoferrum sp.]|jgi:hypothetical protein
MSAALKIISESDWARISATELRSMWPTKLEAIDCDAGDCKTLRREDRAISHECQCCEIFHFEVDRDDHGASQKQRLHTIVLYYSDGRRNETLNAARAFAKSLGLPETDLETIGLKPLQSFHWYVDRNGHREIVLVEIRTVCRHGVWTVFFHVSRQHDEPV